MESPLLVRTYKGKKLGKGQNSIFIFSHIEIIVLVNGKTNKKQF